MLTQSTNYQPSYIPPVQSPLGMMPQKPVRSSGWIWLISAAAIIIAVAGLIYSGGLDAAMKLLGVGASGIYETALTGTNDWLGTSDKPWIIGGADMNGTSVFAKFSSVPNDPDMSAKGEGFVTSIYSSPGDATSERYQIHEYISPIADLTLATPYLSAIQVTDFNPDAASIDYSYRFAGSVDGLATKEFLPLDLTVSNSEANGVKVRAAIIEQTVDRYIQIKFVMNNNTSAARSAVYAVDYQYKESAGVADATQSANQGNAVEREISLQYESVNAPASAEINILSANMNNSIVYTAQGIDLSGGRLAYSFKTALAPGVYALTVSAPLLQTKIVPFLVDQSSNIELNAGSFAQSTAELTGDLNGDGVVNVGDLIMQQRKVAP